MLFIIRIFFPGIFLRDRRFDQWTQGKRALLCPRFDLCESAAAMLPYINTVLTRVGSPEGTKEARILLDPLGKDMYKIDQYSEDKAVRNSEIKTFT